MLELMFEEFDRVQDEWGGGDCYIKELQ